MVPEQLDLLAAAEAARDEGIHRTTASAEPTDIERVDAEIARLAATGEVFSANDARAALDGIKGPLVGARFRHAATSGLITPVSYTPSTDPRTHFHPIRTWRGVTPRTETAA